MGNTGDRRIKSNRRIKILGILMILGAFLTIMTPVIIYYSDDFYNKLNKIANKKQMIREEEIGINIANNISFIYKKEGDFCFAFYPNPIESRLPIILETVDCEKVKDYIVNKKTYLKFHPER